MLSIFFTIYLQELNTRNLNKCFNLKLKLNLERLVFSCRIIYNATFDTDTMVSVYHYQKNASYYFQQQNQKLSLIKTFKQTQNKKCFGRFETDMNVKWIKHVFKAGHNFYNIGDLNELKL